METILVLTGITTRDDTEQHPYRAGRIVASVAELIDELG
jgi:NagD protein